jgi:ribulose-phosphate 3-epimerase
MKSHEILIAPSILSADLTHLQEEVDSVASADWLQVDVMDGHFVPNLSFGAPIIQELETELPLDIHLMVENPADRLKEFIALKPGNITFHAEAVKDTNSRRALIEAIRKGCATAGIALKPGTPVSKIDDCIEDIDLVLIMSVEPGFGGQKFMPEVLEKVRAVRARFPSKMIQMDGGISLKTVASCIEAGANNLVAGSAIFAEKDRATIISKLRKG